MISFKSKCIIISLMLCAVIENNHGDEEKPGNSENMELAYYESDDAANNYSDTENSFEDDNDKSDDGPLKATDKSTEEVKKSDPEKDTLEAADKSTVEALEAADKSTVEEKKSDPEKDSPDTKKPKKGGPDKKKPKKGGNEEPEKKETEEEKKKRIMMEECSTKIKNYFGSCRNCRQLISAYIEYIFTFMVINIPAEELFPERDELEYNIPRFHPNGTTLERIQEREYLYPKKNIFGFSKIPKPMEEDVVKFFVIYIFRGIIISYKEKAFELITPKKYCKSIVKPKPRKIVVSAVTTVDDDLNFVPDPLTNDTSHIDYVKPAERTRYWELGWVVWRQSLVLIELYDKKEIDQCYSDLLDSRQDANDLMINLYHMFFRAKRSAENRPLVWNYFFEMQSRIKLTDNSWKWGRTLRSFCKNYLIHVPQPKTKEEAKSRFWFIKS